MFDKNYYNLIGGKVKWAGDMPKVFPFLEMCIECKFCVVSWPGEICNNEGDLLDWYSLYCEKRLRVDFESKRWSEFSKKYHLFIGHFKEDDKGIVYLPLENLKKIIHKDDWGDIYENCRVVNDGFKCNMFRSLIHEKNY